MAIKGTSMAETVRHVLKSDPCHPDNLFKDNPDRKERKRVPKIPMTVEEVEALGKPTIFILGPLTRDDKIELGDLDSGLLQTPQGMQMTLKNTERAYLTVGRALKGLENFTDEDGIVIGYSSETAMVRGKPRVVAAEAVVNSIPKDAIFELARDISIMNGMRTDLEKKLEGLSAPAVITTSDNGAATTQAVP